MHATRCHVRKQCQPSLDIPAAGSWHHRPGFMPAGRVCSLLQLVQNAAIHKAHNALAAISTNTALAQQQLIHCPTLALSRPGPSTHWHSADLGLHLCFTRTCSTSASARWAPHRTSRIISQCAATTTAATSGVTTTTTTLWPAPSSTWPSQQHARQPTSGKQQQLPTAVGSSEPAQSLSITPFHMDHRQVHVVWCSTNEVDWSKVTIPWLSSLPMDEAETVHAVSEARGARCTRLLARVMQRTAVASALAGLASPPPPPSSSSSSSSSSSYTSHSQAGTHQQWYELVHTGIHASGKTQAAGQHHTAQQQCQQQQPLPPQQQQQHRDGHSSSPRQNLDTPGTIPPSALCFRRNRHGKPFLATQLSSHLNPSSTNDSAGSLSQGTGTGRPPSCIWAADLGTSMPEACQPTPMTTTSTITTLGGVQVVDVVEPCLQFNLSHTNNLVGCAVAPAGVAVGLDVEVRGRVPKGGIMALAKRRFASAEVDALQACPDESSRTELFTYLWTLKEAFVKARGTGISAPPSLRGFTIGVHPPSIQSSSEPDLSPIISQLLDACQATPISTPSPSHMDTRTTPHDIVHHITLNLMGETAQGTLGHRSGPCGCVSKDQPCKSQPQYHLMLMQPSEEHIAALCVALPAFQPKCSWPIKVPQGETGVQVPRGDEHGMRISMWCGVPGQALHPVTCSTGPFKGPGHIRLIGCTTTNMSQGAE